MPGRQVQPPHRAAFPLREWPAADFAMTAQWNLGEAIGYPGKWSSAQRYLERHAAKLLARMHADLPLFLRVGLNGEDARRK